jgi:hypothetical protein
MNHINSVIVNMPTSSVVDRRFEHWSGQSKDYKIGICVDAFDLYKEWVLLNVNSAISWWEHT